MKLFKKAIVSAACGTVFMGSSLLAADEFKFLPIFMDDNYEPQFEVAAVVQSVEFKHDTVTAYGAEISFDCPVFTLPGNHTLRQQLTVLSYDTEGEDTLSIEMNPYYFFKLQDNLQLGVGPGIGGIKTGDEWHFTYQAGAGLKYYATQNILVGADFRWQGVDGVNGADMDNTRLIAKVGYRF